MSAKQDLLRYAEERGIQVEEKRGSLYAFAPRDRDFIGGFGRVVLWEPDLGPRIRWAACLEYLREAGPLVPFEGGAA